MHILVWCLFLHLSIILSSSYYRVGLVSVGWGLLADAGFQLQNLRNIADIRYHFVLHKITKEYKLESQNRFKLGLIKPRCRVVFRN